MGERELERERETERETETEAERDRGRRDRIDCCSRHLKCFNRGLEGMT